MFPKLNVTPLPDHLKWECSTPKKNETVKGVLAGEVQEVAAHWSGEANKPCVRIITDGKLKCHCEDKPCSLRVVGYCPIITRDREKLVVVVAATLIPRLTGLRVGTPIEFSRPNKDKRPLHLSLLRDFDLGEDFVKRMKNITPHDICEYLLHLWQMPELNYFFGVPYYPAAERITVAKTAEEAA